MEWSQLRGDDEPGTSGPAGDDSHGSEDSLADQPTIAHGLDDEAGGPGEGAGDSDTSPDTPKARLAPGAKFGPYEIVRLLGKGGMGEVYAADHPDSGRRVALKILSEELAEATDRKRFLREGRLAAQVSHPNSVYIYGTEEIDGAPVIAMELLPGGTLKDKLKAGGPLPPREAVDAILQIVDGLAAAEAQGVLHRDIKPANCFVDVDGTVKVGDFGLSISTLARDETHLTTTGSFIGTPVFASPEQVQGKQLDVRSDIYSVGATLYFLLTGQPPFQAPGAVQLIAKILQEQPPSPDTQNADIPAALARVVMGFLEKDPAKRTADYAQVRKALHPFSSSVPEPARLALRFAAGIVDGLVTAFLIQLPAFVWGGMEFFTSTHVLWITPAGGLIYYGILEGLWGAAAGKALLGIRVAGSDHGVPGVPKALARAAVFYSPGVLLGVIAVFGFGLNLAEPGVVSQIYGLLVGPTVMAIQFSTARRANGFAALHDLASTTRVVRKSEIATRRLVEVHGEALELPDGATRLGPYDVVRSLALDDAGELLLAYDAALQRPLWILESPEGTPPVPAARHTISRGGRLRWLSGKRADGECWDAFEAPEGEAFLDKVQGRQEWADVRDWIADVAGEIDAGLADGSLPDVVGLDRLWVTNGGRAKLLDFPAPLVSEGAEAGAVSATEWTPTGTEGGGPSSDDMASAQGFLSRVALSALQGRVVEADVAADSLVGPIPLRARSLLADLGNRVFASREELALGVHEMRGEPLTVSRWRRIAPMLVAAFLPVFVGAMYVASSALSARGQTQSPELVELDLSLLRLRSGQRAVDGGDETRAQEVRALEIYISSQFGEIITDPAVRASFVALALVGPDDLETAQAVVDKYPNPSRQEVEDAAALLSSFLDEMPDRVERGRTTAFDVVFRSSFIISTMLRLVAGLALISSVIVAGGVIFRLAGIALVNASGEDIGRIRSLARCALVWSPVFLAWVLESVMLDVLPRFFDAENAIPEWARNVQGPPAVVGISLLVAGAIYALRHPTRGLQDRIAGTWLVPR